MIKKMFTKTAVLMAGIMLVMAITTPALCTEMSSNDVKAQAPLNADEVEQLEARAMNNADLMEIESGGEIASNLADDLAIGFYIACVVIVIAVLAGA